MVKTLGFQSRGSSWGAPRSSQPIIFLRVKFLLFVWVATYKVGVTTLYIDSLMPNFVYWCLALSTLNYLTVKGEIDIIFYIDLTQHYRSPLITIAVFSRSKIEIVWIIITRLMATWRRVFLSVIYCSSISFNYVRSIKKRNTFDLVNKNCSRQREFKLLDMNFYRF